jgi:hypothetical protein
LEHFGAGAWRGGELRLTHVLGGKLSAGTGVASSDRSWERHGELRVSAGRGEARGGDLREDSSGGRKSALRW